MYAAALSFMLLRTVLHRSLEFLSPFSSILRVLNVSKRAMASFNEQSSF